ncbi:hypothetical protein HanOQP8_Chr17g0680171 [Helianthus annuus]|nr:hypothetical protein HanLR1_Chr17g0685281 [Helianthus annuus]KAJ0637983.1 hypothetical protein HanOQP8_Chr17g0680171 [Helianthus annuus]KAJ0815170.1 hypothetical protein HanPSC8_Chr17g0794471 [Helianthus annuus]
MSTGDHHEDSAEEMVVELPPLKWSRETFDGLIRKFKFPESWGAQHPDEGQTAVDAPTSYITLFWDFFSLGNFRLPVTKFFFDILAYYRFHISQLHPIGMARVRHFEFVCCTMLIEPMLLDFECSTKCTVLKDSILLCNGLLPKRFCCNPQNPFTIGNINSFFIKVGVIPMKMVFRGKEDTATETIQTPYSENWYQDLKDVPLIALPEKALVGAAMSLCWRMNREDKPVYMEGDRGKIWGLPCLLSFLVWEDGYYSQKTDEELWYHRIVRNFVLPRDYDLAAQPAAGPGQSLCFSVGELSNLGIGPEKKRRAPSATAVPKKSDVEKTQSSKAKNGGGEKKGMRHSSDSWCDYVVVSDSLEGLAPAVVRKPKPETKDTTDIPPSNPNDPIDLESSPEHLLRKKAGKRKQIDTGAKGQLVKKVQKKKIATVVIVNKVETSRKKLRIGRAILPVN